MTLVTKTATKSCSACYYKVFTMLMLANPLPVSVICEADVKKYYFCDQ